jgi:hypothetical protein
LFGLLALSFCAAACLVTVLSTERGNRWLCDYISSKIGSSIKGRLEVDRIEDLKIDRIVARGVRFIPPDDGPPAIDVPRVTLEFSPLAFLRGHFGWDHAEVEQPVVRVTEREHGKTNMEELFASAKPKSGKHDDGGSTVDLNGMVTHDAKLFIGGGSLPKLYLSKLNGIMRIAIDPHGKATLRFDEYKGKLDGLPTGDLAFHDVKGQVWTDGKRLLHFDGAGKSKGQPVEFDLDITTEPSDVHIGARFEQPSAAALATRMVGAWSTLSSNIDIDVKQQR